MPSNPPKLVLGDFPVHLSQPALRALEFAGYKQLRDLTNVTEKEVANLHGMGPKGVRILKETLHEQGLSFKKGE